MQFKALTWDHPRGFNALNEAACRPELAETGLHIDWQKQPLEGFESHPIEELCDAYDLVVMDHPHVGEAVHSGCLRSLEDLFGRHYVDELGRDSIGPTMASYRFKERHWALPLDAASQVMARRQDLVQTAPVTWQEVLDHSRDAGRVAVSIAGPHALLTFMSICVALGEPPAEADPEELVSEAVGYRALELMTELAGRSPKSVREKNPIGILAHMATHDDVALCPLVFGYVNYAAPASGKPLAFSNAPRLSSGSRPGSTLGGTGIGITRRCNVTAGLMDHLKWLMSREVQTQFIPVHDGQPSNRAAWRDQSVNRRWNNFYRDTENTLTQAYVRPRHNGYIAFQGAASGAIRTALDSRRPSIPLLRELQALYSRHRTINGER